MRHKTNNNENMLLREIAKNIYQVQAENGGKFPYSFSFLLKGKKNILLDAGAGKTNLEKIKGEVGIDLIIISHTHGDHISSLEALAGIPCLVPEMQCESVRDINALGRRFIQNDEKALTVWKHFMVSTLGVRAFSPSGTYNEGDVFKTGEHEIVALSTPGHTVDHFCFFEGRTRTLFSFDIDLTSFGPWYGHEESDIDSFISSIRRIENIRPAILVSSHVPPLSDGISSGLTGYEEQIYKRDERIKTLSDAGLSLAEMLEKSPIYGGHPHIPELLIYFEKVMIEKHLKRLGLNLPK